MSQWVTDITGILARPLPVWAACERCM